MNKASQIALNSSRNIERSFTLMGTAIAGAAATAMGAIGLLIGKTEDMVFSMQKMAQQAGMSMQEFSKFAYIAKVAGMPVDQMAVITTRLAHAQMLAAGGSLEQAAAFKSLGINIADSNGQMKNTGDLLREVAAHLNTFKNSANKTALETIVMGRSGAQAAEFMAQLANRFDELSTKASRLGVVFDQDTAAKAQNLHDAFIDLEEAGEGFAVRILNSVTPALESITEKIVDFLEQQKNIDKITHIGDDLAKGLELAAQAAGFLLDHLGAVEGVIGTLATIRLVSLFGPMITSASEASGIVGKLGVAFGNMAGSALGVRKLGSAVAAGAKGTAKWSSAMLDLAKSEGVAETGAYAYSDAVASVNTALASAAGVAATAALAIAGIAAAGVSVYEVTKATEDLNKTLKDSGEDWRDVWMSSIDTVFHHFKDVIGGIITGDWLNTQLDTASHLAGNSLGKFQPKGGPPSAYGNAMKGVAGAWDGKSDDKADAPNIQLTTKRADELKKKLDELKVAAKAAQDALRLVGASPEQQHQATINKKFGDFKIMAMATQEWQKYSKAQRESTLSEAKAAITTEVMDEAATKYKGTLLTMNEELDNQITEHNALAAALGRSAVAYQNAQVAAQTNAKFTKELGNNWQQNPDAVAKAAEYAGKLRQSLNGGNSDADTKATQSVQLQIDAQLRLNDAILKGADAKNDAAVANQKAAAVQDFNDRGDTDMVALAQKLAGIDKLNDAQRTASDLERAASMDAQQKYQEEIKSIQDATRAAQQYGRAIDYTEVLAAQKRAWMEFQEVQDKAILDTGGAVDGLKVALNQMARNTTTDAQMMYSAFMQVVDALNEAVVKLSELHGRRIGKQISGDFSNMFRSIGGSLMKSSLQHVEGSALKSLGFGGKPDGSQGKPFYVRMAGGLTGAPGSNAQDASMLSNLGSITNSMQQNGPPGGALGFLGSLFQGFRANGGGVVGGVPVMVGEQGPELWTPPAAGTIIPNHKLGGSGDTYIHVDASGSSDPAQTAAMVHAAVRQVLPMAVAASSRHQSDDRARRPRR